MKNKVLVITGLIVVLIIAGVTLDITKTPDTQDADHTIPAYVVIEHGDTASKVYKISGADKTLLHTIPRSPQNPSRPSATISPDGNTLVYADYLGNLNSFSIITGSTTILKKGVSDIEAKTPPPKSSEFYIARRAHFSPDGKKISVNWSGLEWTGIGMMNADGTNYQDIKSRCWINDFSWAPDSQTFAAGAVWNVMSGEPACLYVGNVNTLGQENGHKELLIQESKNVHFPVFSPQGDKIAFSYAHNMSNTSVSDPSFVPQVDLFTIKTDGSGLSRVTIDDIGIVKTLWKDEKTLIYGRGGQNLAGIYSVNIDGTDSTKLTTSAMARYEAVSLSPSGTHLIYQALAVNANPADTALPPMMYVYNFDTEESSELGSNMSFVGWVK